MLAEMQQTQVVSKGSHDKIADLVRVAAGSHDLSGLWVSKPCLTSAEKHSGMHRSQYCTTLGAEDTVDFEKEVDPSPFSPDCLQRSIVQKHDTLFCQDVFGLLRHQEIKIRLADALAVVFYGS